MLPGSDTSYITDRVLFSVNKNEISVNTRSNRAVGRVLMFIYIIDKPCLMSNSLGLASCKCVEL